MKYPQWLLRLMNKNYSPRYELTEKELEILNRLDTHLTTMSATMPSEAVMVLKTYKIGIFSQYLPVQTLCNGLFDMLPKDGFCYLSRSIAFTVDTNGSWCFRIAFREPGIYDEDKCEMFIDLLNRTNNERSSN